MALQTHGCSWKQVVEDFCFARRILPRSTNSPTIRNDKFQHQRLRQFFLFRLYSCHRGLPAWVHNEKVRDDPSWSIIRWFWYMLIYFEPTVGICQFPCIHWIPTVTILMIGSPMESDESSDSWNREHGKLTKEYRQPPWGHQCRSSGCLGGRPAHREDQSRQESHVPVAFLFWLWGTWSPSLQYHAWYL